MFPREDGEELALIATLLMVATMVVMTVSLLVAAFG